MSGGAGGMVPLCGCGLRKVPCKIRVLKSLPHLRVGEMYQNQTCHVSRWLTMSTEVFGRSPPGPTMRVNTSSGVSAHGSQDLISVSTPDVFTFVFHHQHLLHDTGMRLNVEPGALCPSVGRNTGTHSERCVPVSLLHVFVLATATTYSTIHHATDWWATW